MSKRFWHKKGLLSLSLVFAIVMSCFFNITLLEAKSLPKGLAKDRQAPTVPTNLQAISVTDVTASLTWDPSTDNVGVHSYNIYQNNSYIGFSTTTDPMVNDLTPGTTYTFYVRAKDAAGNISASSNTITVTTIQPPSDPMLDPDPILEPDPADPILEPIPPIQNEPRVVGYYASWSAYNGFTPDKIDGSKLTHINYAFANIGTDLKISLGDSWIDPRNFTALDTLKTTYPHLKTLISVGGWTWSGKFSDVALTEQSRSVFADSCVEFITKYGFDGVDLDWEYPVSGGLSSNVKRPEDKQNFTLLLKTLRGKLDQQSALDGKTYLLTMAGGAGAWYVNNTELGILHKYIDFGNIMTYDIHGTWDTYTDFGAPLYNNKDTSPQYKWSVDSGVKAWLNAGFPAEKLVVGVPFYGYRYNSVTNANHGLYQKYSGGSSISYANVVANFLNTSGFVRYYHTESMVPWLFDGTTFISYEDEQSMGLKGNYIKSNALGGAMIWELSHDPNRVLLNALHQGLKD